MICDDTNIPASQCNCPKHVDGSGEAPSENSEIPDGEVDRLLAGVRDGEWLDQQEFPSVRFLVPSLLVEGMTILSGAPKAGKSALMLHVCLSIASGEPALGSLPVSQGEVLYLALEDSDRRMQARCRDLLDGQPIPGDFTYITKVPKGDIVKTIHAWLQRHPDTSLIVLDTLGRVMPPAERGETTYERDYRVGELLKGVSDDRGGLAIVVVHHTRKAASDDFVASSSGTNGLAGSADTITVFTRARHSTQGILAIAGRDVDESQFALEGDPSTRRWVLMGGSLEAAAKAAGDVHRDQQRSRLGGVMDDIIDFVEASDVPVTAHDVVAALEIDVAKARTYLGRATEKQLIDRVGRGLYASIVYSMENPSDEEEA